MSEPAEPSQANIIPTFIDFRQTPLADNYSGCYAVILDNVFTVDECESLLQTAVTKASPTGWEPATVGESGMVHPEYRNSDRILHDDPSMASAIFARIQPFLERSGVDRVESNGDWEHIVGGGSGLRDWESPRGYWSLLGLNERLRFLRYGRGMYFKPHKDGLYVDPLSSSAKQSFLTVHLYLSDQNTNGVVGGATRFWSQDKKHYLDVEPRVGRVLVFQQRRLLHSGEQVEEGGYKYTMRTDVMYEWNWEEKGKDGVGKAN